MKKLISIVLVVLAACCSLPILVLGALLGGGPGNNCAYAAPGASDLASLDPATITEDWDTEQLTMVATIITVGKDKGVPPWGWVIAVATALQESGLRNLPGDDRDSIGLFQQRPSQGWGTPEQLADPAYQAGKFFDTLLTIDGWQQMPLTEAAQAVQRSAYPDAYQKWTKDAILLVSHVGSTLGLPGVAVNPCTGVSAQGWTQPVRASIVSGFRTPERPDHHGIDLGAACGTVIVVAASGTVVRVRCNVEPASWGCDQDGNPSVLGCGWYADVAHPDGVMTRYCHMGTQPWVSVGDPVIAGQPLGVVGSSGNSSGPHLHYEVHTGGDSGNSGAVDPAAWMQDHGASLGTP